MPQPYKLFTIYAREDAHLLEELRGQLRPLEHAGRIRVWSDREINPGVDWEREIVQNLDSADIILILVSAAYYNSAYIHEKEIKYAISRHERGEAKVLPVIVRPCSFLDDPVISRLQVLPTDGKPVDSHFWRKNDDAWLDVVAGVKRTVEIIRDAENRSEQEIRDAAERERLAAERKKEEEKRARQAESDARERAERERREAEQRTREEQARYEREAKERAENEHLAQLRREQEQAARRTEQTAWQQAAAAHDIPAYENYLARYPQGEYAREARARIKELKKKEAASLPWGRYTTIGGGVLVLLLVVWLIFRREKEQTAQNQAVQPPDTTQLSESSRLPESLSVSKDTTQSASVEKPKQDTVASKPPFKDPFEGQMVRVLGGTFTMGQSDPNIGGKGYSKDECPHEVTVGSFSICKYEVTQLQWKTIMGNNPSKFKGCDNCPVEQASLYDIQKFIKKLNAATGKRYRLPTEAEWEYAAKGGNKSKGYKYAGSDNLGSVAWYDANSNSKTRPVGSKLPNELGLYDMSGNVRERCSDIYKPYPCAQTKIIESETNLRLIRGGSWGDVDAWCRSTKRNSDYPSGWNSRWYGFRLAHN